MNYLSNKPVELKIYMASLFFHQCKSRINQCLIFLCVLRWLSGKKFSCTSIKYPESSIEQKMSNEPNFSKRPDHPTNNTVIPAKAGIQSINQQRTMNNQLCSNEPNLSIRPVLRSSPSAKKEPNLLHDLSIDQFEQKMQKEPNLRQITHYNNEPRTMPALSSVEGNYEQFSNEPNFEND